MEYTVKDMIELLSKYPGDATVDIKVHTSDTGVVYHKNDIDVYVYTKNRVLKNANKTGVKKNIKGIVFS